MNATTIILHNLLARIHRDGGQHTAKVGLEQSALEADRKVADMIGALYLEPRPSTTMTEQEITDAAIAVRSFLILAKDAAAVLENEGYSKRSDELRAAADALLLHSPLLNPYLSETRKNPK